MAYCHQHSTHLRQSINQMKIKHIRTPFFVGILASLAVIELYESESWISINTHIKRSIISTSNLQIGKIHYGGWRTQKFRRQESMYFPGG